MSGFVVIKDNLSRLGLLVKRFGGYEETGNYRTDLTGRGQFENEVFHNTNTLFNGTWNYYFGPFKYEDK